MSRIYQGWPTPEDMDAANQASKRQQLDLSRVKTQRMGAKKVVVSIVGDGTATTLGCMVAELMDYRLIKAGVLVSFKSLSCMGSKYLYEYADGGDVGKLRHASAELSFIAWQSGGDDGDDELAVWLAPESLFLSGRFGFWGEVREPKKQYRSTSSLYTEDSRFGLSDVIEEDFSGLG